MLQVVGIWVCVQYLGVWIDIWACVLYLGAWLIFGSTKIVAPRYGAKNRIGVAIFAIHHKDLVWFALVIKSLDGLGMIYDQDKTYFSSRDLWSRPIPVLPRYLVVLLKLQILRQIANLVLIVLHMINLILTKYWDPCVIDMFRFHLEMEGEIAFVTKSDFSSFELNALQLLQWDNSLIFPPNDPHNHYHQDCEETMSGIMISLFTIM